MVNDTAEGGGGVGLLVGAGGGVGLLVGAGGGVGLLVGAGGGVGLVGGAVGGIGLAGGGRLGPDLTGILGAGRLDGACGGGDGLKTEYGSFELLYAGLLSILTKTGAVDRDTDLGAAPVLCRWDFGGERDSEILLPCLL